MSKTKSENKSVYLGVTIPNWLLQIIHQTTGELTTSKRVRMLLEKGLKSEGKLR